MNPEVAIVANKDAIVTAVAERFVTTVRDVLAAQDVCRVVVTGGSVGIAVLAGLRDADVDWTRVHIYWGDERFVAADSPDRNARQAREALLDHIQIPAGNIFELAASDEDLDLDQAAIAASYEYEASFDITFLGMGPDAHVASLFPHHEGVQVTGPGVIAVRNSPKPPPERLSLTRDSINASARVWFVIGGADKAEALHGALHSDDPVSVPAAGARGQLETVFFVDEAAAADLS